MGISPAARLGMVRKGEIMSKYKIEMIVEVNGHPRKWIPETVAMSLEDGEDILKWSIEEVEDE
jgi:hypothetical protein